MLALPEKTGPHNINGDINLVERSNQIPCHCELCGGRLRDKRTVRRHYKYHPYPKNCSLSGSGDNLNNSNLTDNCSANSNETYRRCSLDRIGDNNRENHRQNSGGYEGDNGCIQNDDSGSMNCGDGQACSNSAYGGNYSYGGLEENNDNIDCCTGEDSSASGRNHAESASDNNFDPGGGSDGCNGAYTCNDIYDCGIINGWNGSDHDGTSSSDQGSGDDNGKDSDSNSSSDNGYNDNNDGTEDNTDTDWNVEDENESIDESGSDCGNDDFETKLEKCILRIIDSKIKFGWSQEETLSQLQNLYELTGCNSIPHQTWPAVMSFWKRLGYKNPRHYKVCCGNDHVVLVEGDICSNCGKLKGNCVDYFVLGLNIESIFLNENNAKKHLAHWEEQDEWFNIENITVPLKEIWHGSRFRELSYFWDANKETLLPTSCPNCGNIISVEEITLANSLDRVTPNVPVHLSCGECTFDFVHTPATARGSPLNQAFIFHEDGFNAFSKKSRGIAAIHISNACSKKELRLHGKNLKVYSFIPIYLLKEGIPHKMDPFLKPLIDEITELYVNGRDIYMKAMKIGNFSLAEATHNVRGLLLLGTADLKAHQEIVLYAGGGKMGCRRCLVSGTYIPCRRHYYYGDYRRRYRDQTEHQTAEYQRWHGNRVDNAITFTKRQRIQTETGVSGLSILFELYKLYKFDPVLDMTVDRMHLTFNMLKKEFVEKMWADLGENAGKEVDERDPLAGGLLDRNEFKHALLSVEWTAEDKSKGVGRLSSLTDKLGSLKSSEFKRFSTVAREVLAQNIPSKAYDCYMILCDLVRMLYSKHLQATGWQDVNIRRLETLIWTHAIKAEEYYGLAMCTENLENSVHIIEDIRRHSSMDNYSCELYERAILRHKAQKHNSKGLETTFAKRESIRNFLHAYQEKNGPLSEYRQDAEKYNFDHREQPYLLKESSFAAAKALLLDIKHLEAPPPALQHAIAIGVIVGQKEKKVFPDCILADLRRYFTKKEIPIEAIPNVLQSVKSVALVDEVGEIERFTTGTVCKIDSGEPGYLEWTMKIENLFQVGPIENKYFTFVNGPYFIPTINNGNTICHQWTETAELVPRIYVRDSIQPTSMVKRKVIMYPNPSNLQDPEFHLCIDIKNPEFSKECRVPPFPKEEDTVQILGDSNQVWYAVVKSVQYLSKKAVVQWYQQTKRRDVWSRINQEDEVYFASIVKVCYAERVFGGYRIL